MLSYQDRSHVLIGQSLIIPVQYFIIFLRPLNFKPGHSKLQFMIDNEPTKSPHWVGYRKKQVTAMSPQAKRQFSDLNLLEE